jgi:hypothetical protein
MQTPVFKCGMRAFNKKNKPQLRLISQGLMLCYFLLASSFFFISSDLAMLFCLAYISFIATSVD